MRTFVAGDLHGGYRALVQCLDAANFVEAEDRLICLGDLCDGWPQTREIAELLLRLPNVVCVRGNHDQFFIDWMDTGLETEIWIRQGGRATLASYPDKFVDERHRAFFRATLPYYTEAGVLFVHAGFDPGRPLGSQDPDFLQWDRTMIQTLASEAGLRSMYQSGAQKGVAETTNEGQSLGLRPYADRLKSLPYRRIILGHTPTMFFFAQNPISLPPALLLDTGAGWPDGRLTVMNLASGEYFMSDTMRTLYPGVEARG